MDVREHAVGGHGAVLALELERFRYSGAGSDTLCGIKLSVAAGSLTAIVGDSGSGKSTLGAVLAGMLPRHDGDELEATIELAGQRIRHGARTGVRIDAVGWSGQVGLLPQDAGHYLSGVRETVAEELALGLENAGVPRDRMRARIEGLADRLGLHGLLSRDPERLSGGQERVVALAALALSAPPVLVLDEPLAGLDSVAVARVTALLGRLRAGGTALVLLTRSLDTLAVGADQVLSLRGGRCHPTTATQRATTTPVAHRAPRATRTAHEDAAVLLGFSGASLGYPGAAGPVVTGLDLELRAGECLALAGLNGAGKSTVLKGAAGLLHPSAGRALGLADAQAARFARARARTRAAGAVGLLLQNPAEQLFERTVLREVAFGLSKRGPEAARIPAVLAALGLADAAETHPYELPASARRLVALATVLVRGPRVLLLDEPTEALDADGVARLQAALGGVLDSGGAVLLATHDETFMSATAHRVHRMGPAGATLA